MKTTGGAEEVGGDEVVFSAQEMCRRQPFLGVRRSRNNSYFDAYDAGIRAETPAHILLVDRGGRAGTVERPEVHRHAWLDEQAETVDCRLACGSSWPVPKTPHRRSSIPPQPVDESGGEKRWRHPTGGRAARPFPALPHHLRLMQRLVELPLQGKGNYQVVSGEMGQSLAGAVVVRDAGAGQGNVKLASGQRRLGRHMEDVGHLAAGAGFVPWEPGRERQPLEP